MQRLVEQQRFSLFMSLATAALLQVANEDEPDANRFLVAVCAASLRHVLIDFYQESQAALASFAHTTHRPCFGRVLLAEVALFSGIKWTCFR